MVLYSTYGLRFRKGVEKMVLIHLSGCYEIDTAERILSLKLCPNMVAPCFPKFGREEAGNRTEGIGVP